MKTLTKYILILSTLLAVTSFSSCDLSLQKSYDFDGDAHWETPEPFDFSIYQYITQEDEFTLMAKAIQRVNMQKTYSEGNPPVSKDSNTKTVFLLRNEAMKEFLDDYRYESVDAVPVETLQNLLQYHVIPGARVKQRDVHVQEHTIFQTLVNGEDGLIDIWVYRDFWIMNINSTGSNFPTTTESATVFLHNFEFTNGIAHQLKSYSQRIPFE